MDKKLVALLIISLSSFSAQVQAISEHHSSNVSTEVKKNSVDHFLMQLSNFISVSEQKPTLNTVQKTSKKSVGASSRLPYNKMTHVTTTGATGMFRRVVNAPSAGGKLSSPIDSKASVSKKLGMVLSASVSQGMGLQNKDFIWSIKSSDGKISIQKKGKKIASDLPAGKYKVKLTVAGSTVSKSLTLNSALKEEFKLSLGRINSSVSFAGGTPKSSWGVYKMKGSKRGSKVYSAKKASSINRVLEPGKYEIVVAMGSVSSSKVITVASGKTNKSALRLEGSKVKLLVTKSDLKSPLIKKTKWVIKNTNTNKVVLTKNRHSATVTLPPGKYVASATSGGVTKAKSFVVKPGKESNIFVAME